MNAQWCPQRFTSAIGTREHVRVLVPLAVLEGETVSPEVIDFLSTVDVPVLGYHVPPEQTSAEQARDQLGERAESALKDVIQEFQQTGGDADYLDSGFAFGRFRRNRMLRFRCKCLYFI